MIRSDSTHEPCSQPGTRIGPSRAPIVARIAGTLVILLGAATPRGLAQNNSYEKVLYVDNVAAGAPIKAGARVQTWRGNTLPSDTVTIAQGTKPINYKHASGLTGRQVINGGLPISTVANTTVDSRNGYSPPALSLTDNSNAANSATATLAVAQRVPGNGPQVKIRVGSQTTGNVTLVDSVKVTIGGSAAAGAPMDARWHSADSFGGVAIAGAQTYRVTSPGDIPIVGIYGQNTMIGGRAGISGLQGKQYDPYFVTVTDQTTGKVLATQEVMSQTLQYRDASYSIDDTGIRLSVARNDPGAFATLAFSTDTSSGWVQNDYSYGATLTDSGLTAYGETPLSGWSVTETATTIDAFFAFTGGQPFDDALVLPPSSLYQVNGTFTGDTYSNDVGSTDGVVSIAQAVPEPSSLILYATGLVAVLGMSARARARGRPAR